MRISQAFPSKYLKAEDIGNQRWTLTIRTVVMEDVGDNENKPIVYFSELEKGLVLNKTNAEMAVQLYGDDTDRWAGGHVEMYATPVMYGGKSTMGLRIMAPPPQMPAHQGVTTPQAPGQPPYQPPGMPNLTVQQPPAPGMPDPWQGQRQVHQAPDPNAPTAPQGGGAYKPDPLDDSIPF
jgi:hypothetical protein